MVNKIGSKSRMRYMCLILIVTLYSCHNDRYYTGYILKSKKLPLVGAKIYELHSPIDTAFIDSSGFFILRRHPEKIDHLVVESDDNIDTIDIVQRFYNEHAKILFTSNKKDTFYLREPKEGSREQ